MNLGARQADGRSIDTDELAAAASGVSLMAHEWATIQRQADSAAEWAHERGNTGDADINLQAAAERLADAASHEVADETARAAARIYGAQMHPTARDIVGGAAAQAIYSLTGKRAHKWAGDGE